MWLGSSSESNIRMKPMFDNVVIQSYMPSNPEWELLNTTGRVFSSTYSNGTGSISAIASHDLMTSDGFYINMQGFEVNSQVWSSLYIECN